MILYEQALAKAIEAAQNRKLETETVPLSETPGRVCAQTVTAPITIQPFDNSAMDGYALRYEDIREAANDAPVSLRMTGTIAAGQDGATGALQPNTCMKIMTGAPVPEGADTVVPVELATAQGEEIFFSDPLKPHANVRFAGEDFKTGNAVLEPGMTLGATQVLPLATLGIGRVEVFKKPRGAFLSTGKELVDDLDAALGDGQIYNSNRPYGVAALEELGAEVISAQTVPDDTDAFEKSVKALIDDDPDFVVSSGAVSAGDFDFVKTCLKTLGAEILYHKVKMKPGKPNLLARLPNGAPWFGLPGNPVATAVGLRFFVAPALREMHGLPPEQPVMATATNGFKKKPGMRMFLKAVLSVSEDGKMQAEFKDGQASFMVSPFLDMNAWIAVDEDTTEIGPGDMVEAYPLFASNGVILN